MTSHTCHKGEVCPKYILCGSCRYEKSGIGINALRVASIPDRQLVFQPEKEKILVCIKAIWDYGEDEGFEGRQIKPFPESCHKTVRIGRKLEYPKGSP